MDYWSSGGAGLASDWVLCGGVERDTEENDGFEAAVDEWGEEWNEFVDSATVLTRETCDEGFFVVVVGDEEGVDEHFLFWGGRKLLFLRIHDYKHCENGLGSSSWWK